MSQTAQPLAHSIDTSARIAGCGVSKIYEEIAKGALRARKMGKRTLILHSDLEDWLQNLPRAEVTYQKR